MRWLLAVVSVGVLVGCDSRAGNTASRVAGEEAGGGANETVRIAEESAKAALEESRGRRLDKMSHFDEAQGLMQGGVRQAQENYRLQRMREDRGFPGKFDDQGFPGKRENQGLGGVSEDQGFPGKVERLSFEESMQRAVGRQLDELKQQERLRAERARNQRPWK